MPSHQSPDGTWHHTFSASWLKEFATCPEKARRRYFGITPSKVTEFTSLGSAVHAGIEYRLRGLIDGTPTNQDGMHAVGHDKLAELWSDPTYTAVKLNEQEQARLVAQHLDTFADQLLPHLQPLVAEEMFNLPLYKDGFRTINIRGAIDCVDRNLGVIDWKTAGSAHKQWEKQRYEVQPTVYTWAWNTLQAAHIDHMRYVVFIHDKGIQEYTVTRNSEHVDWMTFQALAAARQVESGLPIWTMNDGGWWCAAKWCSAYDACKGSFIKETK